MNGTIVIGVVVEPKLALALGISTPEWARRCLLMGHRVVAVGVEGPPAVGHFCQTCGKDRA